jgi:hypothetical protein
MYSEVVSLSQNMSGAVNTGPIAYALDSNDHLSELLSVIDRLDHFAAVRFAIVIHRIAEGDAVKQGITWNFLYEQAAFPRCEYCEWPVADGQPHEYCAEQLAPENPDDSEEGEQGSDEDRTLSDEAEYHPAYDELDEDDVVARVSAGIAKWSDGNPGLAREAHELYPGDFA